MPRLSPSPEAARDLERFLRRWFAHLPPSLWAELKPLRKAPGPDRGKPGAVAWVQSADEARERALAADAEGWDVFLGAQPRLRPAGGLYDVGPRRWLFADLDVGDVGHGGAPTHATENDALAALARAPSPPTLLVHTGGGLHAWWALVAEAPPDAWEEAERRLVAAVGADPAGASAHQVLRLPGTHNWKTGAPRPVRLLDAGEAAHPLAPFLALPPAASPPEARPSGGPPAGGAGLVRLVRRDLPFERAKNVPVADVLAWLGVKVARGRCACPCHGGTNETSMQAGGDRGNVATCYAGCATAGAPRAYTTVDLVARVRGVTPREAVDLLAEAFGFAGFQRGPAAAPPAARGSGEGRGAGGEGAPPSGRGRMPPSGKGGPPEPPTVVITTRELDVADQALAALAASGEPVFARGSRLVAVLHEGEATTGVMRAPGAPRVQTLAAARLRSMLSACATWVRHKPKDEGFEIVPAHVPDWAVKDLEARGQWAGIRPLEGVVECPVLRPDGTVLERPGYDDATGLYYAPNGPYPALPERPTQDDARAACAALLEAVDDFPFEQPCHRSAWLAGLLTPFARYAFRGSVPLFLVDANIRGAGKSLLTDCIAEVFGGRPMGGMTQATDDSEERKRITSLLLDGSPLLLIDNITRPLGSDALVMLLTREEWSDRALGGNEAVRLPNSAVWYATGNNVQLRGDMGRRVVHIRLRSPDEQPERRTGFRHNPLLGWVRRERFRLAACALTVLRAYCAEGRPGADELSPWGSFDAWSALVRGALVWAGQPDPGDAREDLVQVADHDANLVRDLVAGWAALDPGGGGMTVGEALGKLEASPGAHEAFRAALAELLCCPPGKLPSSSRLGAKLRSVRGRNVGGRCIELSRKSHGYNRWIVAPVNGAAGAEPAVGASVAEAPERADGARSYRVWP